MKTYTYDKLRTKEAKKKARDWYRDGDDFDASCVTDDAERILEMCGFSDVKIMYQGFWSQGDGACFTGSWYANSVNSHAVYQEVGDSPSCLEIKRIAIELMKLRLIVPHMRAVITHHDNYYHERSVNYEFNWEEDKLDQLDYDSPAYKKRKAILEDHEQEFRELARSAMKWIYKNLEDDYNWRNDDEQVIESILANEYQFTYQGEEATP